MKTIGCNAKLAFLFLGLPLAAWPQVPVITSQPQNVTVSGTYPASLSVGASGVGTLSYQWFWNGTNAVAGATNAQLSFASAGVTNSGSYTVVVNSAGGAVTSAPATLKVYTPYLWMTYAGAQNLHGTTDGLGTAARFDGPTGLSLDKVGDLVVADSLNSSVRLVTPGGPFVSTLATGLNDPLGTAVDAGGNIYVSEHNANTIEKIGMDGTVSALAGGSTGTNDGVGAAARFNGVEGLAADKMGDVFVADYGGDTIRAITPDGTVSTLAGEPEMSQPTGQDGVGGAARFFRPESVCLQSNGPLYVADTSDSLIRRIDVNSRLVTTVAGDKARAGGYQDGNGTNALFSSPKCVSEDEFGVLYVADSGNRVIRRIDPDGAVSTIGGTSGAVFANGLGSASGFGAPASVCVDGAGNVFVGDGDTVRIGVPDYGQPIFAGLTGLPWPGVAAIGTNLTMSFHVIHEPASYQWLWNGRPLGLQTNATLAISNMQASQTGGYSLIASNAAGVVTSAVVTVTVMAPPQIVVQPANNDAVPGETMLLSVGATGDHLTYLWHKYSNLGSPNKSPIVGATNATLWLTNVSATTYYDVYVSNLVGAVTSAKALISVGGTAVGPGEVDGSWMAAGSPYVVTNDVAIGNLNVGAGTVVWVNGPYSLTVTGSLTTTGTASQSVEFEGPAWNGLRFVSGAGSNSLNWTVVTGAREGAIRCTNTSLALTNCVITNNLGAFGGGLYTDSDLSMSNCLVGWNQALPSHANGAYYTQGGGLYIAGGAATLVSNRFVNNAAVMPNLGPVTATASGGAIDCEGGSVSLLDCQVTGNQAAAAGLSPAAFGGGIFANADTGATASAMGCLFGTNSATGGFGGAVAAGSASLAGCNISANQAVFGGALYASGAGDVRLTNCLLAWNEATLGGAVYGTAPPGAGMLDNCTVADNAPDGLAGFGGLVQDSIVYFNGVDFDNASPTVLFSDVESAGGKDPQFADTNLFTLQGTSPCVDTGDPGTNHDDASFPPSQGTDANDQGWTGGPLAALAGWLRTNAPVIYINGQASAPYQVWAISNGFRPTFTISNGLKNWTFAYTLDGSDPAQGSPIAYTAPVTVSNSVAIRAVAYSPDTPQYTVSAPVYVEIPSSVFPFVVSTPGGGTVAYNQGLYLSNSTATALATPLTGWQFMWWTNGAQGTNPLLTVTVNQALTNVEAIFGTRLTNAVQPAGAGTTQNEPELSLYPYNTQVEFTATPSAGRYFTNWAIGATKYHGSPLDLLMTNANPTVTAVFAPQTSGYYVNILLTSGGTASQSPNGPLYANGAMVTNTAVPQAGYAFSGWSGAISSAANPLVFAVSSNTTITANFIFTNFPASPPGPPVGVAITNPAPNESFTLPANVTIQATATDTNAGGSIKELIFIADGALIGTATNAPFGMVWTNPPAGEVELTAVAVDNLGAAATSAPVAIAVSLPPPGPPVFTLSKAAYTVAGNAGSVTVTALKSANSLGGSVTYMTTTNTVGGARPLTNGYGDFQATNGVLTFAAGDSAKEVTIPIYASEVYQGNKTFNVVLTQRTGGTVGSPSTAVITIVDVNPPPNTNASVLANYAPDPPAAPGQLQVYTVPTTGQWRLATETIWHPSGAVVEGLPGLYEVHFAPVVGFQPPDATNYFIAPGTSLAETNRYVPNEGDVYGGLQVRWDAVSLGGWRIEGETNWLASGEVAPNLIPGEYLVEFEQLTNFASPAPQAVYVDVNQINSVQVDYFLPPEVANTPPTAVPAAQAAASPYYYGGQLVSDAGSGSGWVVEPRVVLTAGHMVFNAATLAYVDDETWYFQRLPQSNGPPLAAAGYYLMDGYAAAKTNDETNKIIAPDESLAAQALDVATVFFLQDAGRHGYSGYLVSVTNGTPWLQFDANKTLAGYPVQVVSPVNALYSTFPGDYEFDSTPDGRVFTSIDIVSYGGNSGGALLVQWTNGTYYPAGVYLGGSDKAYVRAIDGPVSDMINRAALSGDTDENHTSGGVVTLVFNGTGSSFGQYSVVIEPPEAVSAGAGWRITNFPGSSFTNDTSIREAGAGSYTMAFGPAPGWIPPTNTTLRIRSNQKATITATYAPAARFIGITLNGGILTLSLAASNGQSFALEQSTNLVNWMAVATNSADAQGSLGFTNNISTLKSPAAFYRVRAISD